MAQVRQCPIPPPAEVLLSKEQLKRFRWKEEVMEASRRASAQRPPPHAQITISRRSRAWSLHLHRPLRANSRAPATRRLIKAMHLFMTELIRQGKRWSPHWKHISPWGNCLWSRTPRAVSGQRFWIFVTNEETQRCGALKKQWAGSEKHPFGAGHSSGCIWSCLNWSHNCIYRAVTRGGKEILLSGLVLGFIDFGCLMKSVAVVIYISYKKKQMKTAAEAQQCRYDSAPLATERTPTLTPPTSLL